MNITTSLLYLLMLYAVLDKEGKLPLTTGLVVAFGILLFNCHLGDGTSRTVSGSGFSSLNGCG